MEAPRPHRWPTALSVLRTSQWSHFALLPLAGVELRALTTGPALVELLFALAAGAGCLAFAYGVNAVAERATDRSPEKNPLVGLAAVPPGVRAVVIASAVAALGCGARLGALALSLVLVSLAAGAAYSLGPRLKARPGWGLFINDAIFVPLLGLAVHGAALPPGFWVLAICFTGLLTQNQLVHELADVEEDTASHAVTTGRWLGPRRTRVAVALASALSLTGAVLVGARPAVLAAAVLLLSAGAVVAVPLRVAALADAPAALLARDAADRRRAHRLVAAVGGAMLYLVAHLS